MEELRSMTFCPVQHPHNMQVKQQRIWKDIHPRFLYSKASS